jgi:caffeoyl-CoA O-methyltransferase
MLDPEIKAYAAAHTTAFDEQLAKVAASTRDVMPWPQMMSGLVESRLLESLIAISGARRVLEVGTFTGVGALSMAAALPADGELMTIEFNEDTAALARDNIARSEHAGKIELIVGDAREELAKLEGPFDLVFIDAWKADYIHYYEAALAMLSPRGIIVADNVLWGGTVVDESATDGETRSVRAFNEHVQDDARVRNVLLTVGDGLMVVWRS